jgi:hypothetical protein
VTLPAIAAFTTTTAATAPTASATTTAATTTTAAAASAPAAAAAASATTTAATETTTAATASAWRALLSFVDHQCAAIELRVVHFLNGGLCSRLLLEGYKAEPSRAPGFPIRDDLGIFDSAEALKSNPQTIVIRIPTEAAYKKSSTHFRFSIS